MKRATFKLHQDKNGWLRTTLGPVNHKDDFRFGAMDICMLMALVLGTAAVARLLIAH
jgi:hypothetical protein